MSLNVKLLSLFAAASLSLVACSSETNNEEIESTESTDQSQAGEEGESEMKITVEPYNLDSLTVLVNKETNLPEDHVPNDLVTIDVPVVNQESVEINQLRQEAADRLSDLFDAAAADGIELVARSGFRSYSTQDTLFNNYVANHGYEEASRFSAKPGTSEHQTGLAMDITSAEVGYDLVEEFINTESGSWLADHAHEYGFVMRYPQGKEDITGYQFEPWHYRYFGQELSRYLYEEDLTYEEFLENNEQADIQS